MWKEGRINYMSYNRYDLIKSFLGTLRKHESRPVKYNTALL